MIDPTQQQAAPGAPAKPQASGAICIAPQAPGMFAVYREGAEPSGEPVDLDEALEQARQMLGGEKDGAGEEGMDEAAALLDGFKGAKGQVGG